MNPSFRQLVECKNRKLDKLFCNNLLQLPTHCFHWVGDLVAKPTGFATVSKCKNAIDSQRYVR
jgi:hypothetical protein